MKKANFLAKLYKKSKLQLVEPSKTIKDSYIEKSESNLVSAKILLKSDKLEEAVALSYYSMYNMLTALLFQIGIKCENHTGSIILLKKVFDIDNSEISTAKQERIDKQYYVDFKINKEEVLEAIKKAEDFNKNLLDFISKLNTEKINDFREKFESLL